MVLLSLGAWAVYAPAALGAHARRLGRPAGGVPRRDRPRRHARDPLRRRAVPERLPHVRGLSLPCSSSSPASRTRPRRSSCASGSRSTEGRARAARLRELRARSRDEAVALSTCNRTELYLSPPTRSPPSQAALRRLARAGRTSGRPSSAVTSTRCSGDGGRAHLFRVTASLDSMIVGEAEIHGQVKRAYELALARAAAPAPILNRLFRARARGRQAGAHRDRDRRATRCRVSSVAVELAAAGPRRPQRPHAC